LLIGWRNLSRVMISEDEVADPTVGGAGGGPFGSDQRASGAHHRDPSRDHLPPACPGPGPGRPDQRDRGLPHLRRLPDDLLPLGRPRPTLRAGRAAAQRPAAAGNADRHPTRPAPGGAGRGGRPTDPGRPPTGQPPRRPGSAPVSLRRSEDPAAPPARPPRPAGVRLAQLTAATTGIPTTPAKDGPFGFCHFAARPGDLVALDTFYVGKLKGIGPVWQLTAVDTATRYAVASLVPGDKSARDAASFVDHVAERLAGIGAELTGVLTDNGPEFTGHGFTSHLKDLAINHHRIPPRSPNHNAVCERFQGTALQEFYRPAFHRQRFARLADLNAQLQGWLQTYNTRRCNHGDFMRGRTPFAVMEAHLS